MVYVPILRLKKGEVTGLRDCGPSELNRIVPLWVVFGDPEDVPDCDPAKIAKYLADTEHASNMVDVATNCGDPSVLRQIAAACSANGVEFIPVIAVDSDPAFVAAAREVSEQLALRVLDVDFDTKSPIEDLLASNGLEPSQIHIIYDLGTVSERCSPREIRSVAGALLDIMSVGNWASVTCASGAMSNPSVPAFSLVRIPRHDWELWTRLIAISGMADVGFGDYAAFAPPPYIRFDPKTMSSSPKVRYASPNSWLFIRSKSYSSGGASNTGTICTQIVSEPEYTGPVHCTADAYIHDCARGVAGPGNAMTWVAVATNRHMAVTGASYRAVQPASPSCP